MTIREGITTGASLSVFFVLSFVVPTTVQAQLVSTPEIRVWNSRTQTLVGSFLAGAGGDAQGVRVAVGDVTGDGMSEIIAAEGSGGGSTVRIYRQDGVLLRQFDAYSAGYDRGVNIAVGDLNGDGRDEIVTGTDHGGAPHVRVFDGYGAPAFTPGFFAYEQSFRGGVSVAVGDVNGDGRDEIVTGAGPGGGPHVRVFDRFGAYLGIDFFPFHGQYRGGVNVATANVDGTGPEEILVSVNQAAAPEVKVYRADESRTLLTTFYAYDYSMTSGVHVAAADVDRNGTQEIVTTPRQGGAPHVRVFSGNGSPMHAWFAYDTSFRNGVSIAAGPDARGNDVIVTGKNRQASVHPSRDPKLIVVDISEQRLYAYEYGVQVNTFLVSTGLWNSTKIGQYHILEKIYSHLYAGPGYYLPNTLYNMRYLGPYYLHGAYWHNNFGHPMSHGCTNISYENAKWLFDWSAVGTPVHNQP